MAVQAQHMLQQQQQHECLVLNLMLKLNLQSDRRPSHAAQIAAAQLLASMLIAWVTVRIIVCSACWQLSVLSCGEVLDFLTMM